MMNSQYDLCVIGGGINGAGIARDAAGRGLSVLLVEAKDLAQGTSSASTKLVHGGLRYLEFFEFKMVRDALKEREKLLSIAPHLIYPMRFIMPYGGGTEKPMRPAWMVRLGLFLYDRLARRAVIPSSSAIDLDVDAVGCPLQEHYRSGFCYYDCWADDARLVVLNALDAAERGARIAVRTRCTNIREDGQGWRLVLQHDGGQEEIVRASMVVNAAGPWVENVLEDSGLGLDAPSMRLVKGSHIIIPKAFDGGDAYILSQADGRIVFAIPYESDYTLVGTTEADVEGDLYDVRASNDEIQYLCDAFSQYFKKKITPSDVLWTYSGVRPLCDDGQGDARKVSRDYLLYDHPAQSGRMISVYGGKLTTYRKLAEDVLDKLLMLDNRYANAWTDEQPLPGGDMRDGDFNDFVAHMRRRYDWLDETLLYRYARLYGTRMERFLEGVKCEKDLGRNFGDGLYEVELLYLVRCEWVREVEDALFRRTKMELHISQESMAAIEKAWPEILKKAQHG